MLFVKVAEVSFTYFQFTVTELQYVHHGFKHRFVFFCICIGSLFSHNYKQKDGIKNLQRPFLLCLNGVLLTNVHVADASNNFGKYPKFHQS